MARSGTDVYELGEDSTAIEMMKTMGLRPPTPLTPRRTSAASPPSKRM